jgi:hypothetical protein
MSIHTELLAGDAKAVWHHNSFGCGVDVKVYKPDEPSDRPRQRQNYT